MSTYYQDNPWDILTYSKKYDGGIPVMGGEINPNQKPGYRPGNTYSAFSQTKGIERFGNGSGNGSGNDNSSGCNIKYYALIIILVLLFIGVLYYFNRK
jgi:hypothetical protein